MAKVKVSINMLVSILKYIDIEYMTDEETNSIYDLDINDEKDQKKVIQNLIASSIKEEFSEDEFITAKEVLEMGINNIDKATKVIERMSFPFESDIEDKKAFLEIIYEELFGKEDIVNKQEL